MLVFTASVNLHDAAGRAVMAVARAAAAHAGSG